MICCATCLFLRTPFTEGCAGAKSLAPCPSQEQEQASKQRCTFSHTTFSSVQFRFATFENSVQLICCAVREAGSFPRSPSRRRAIELIVKPCPLAARICCTFRPTSFSSVQFSSAFGSTFLLWLCLMLVGTWFGLYWVLFSFFDHYIYSSVNSVTPSVAGSGRWRVERAYVLGLPPPPHTHTRTHKRVRGRTTTKCFASFRSHQISYKPLCGSTFFNFY